ncbi:MAG: phytanoyl-CoA dioxygenase family protein [Halioglobus sp.]
MDLSHETQQFEKDGYVVVRQAFRSDEMSVIRDVVTGHDAMNAYAERLLESCVEGERPAFKTLFVWNDTSGNDLFSLATRSHKVFDRLEAYFGDEVYDYHNKVILKYPGIVGLSYHQDYAYWYQMGNLLPDMAACYIAVDNATRENGCLKIIEGSHKLGRIDPVNFESDGDSGIDPERLTAILERFPERHLELESGDMVIFHANVLHGSDDNNSDQSRLALIGTYNTRHNDPYIHQHGHPGYRHQSKLYDEITSADAARLPDFELDYLYPGSSSEAAMETVPALDGMSFDRAREILPALGSALEELNAEQGLVFDVSRLPFDKKTIQDAVLKIVESIQDPSQTKLMTGVLRRVAEFQDGVGHEPVPMEAAAPGGEPWHEVVEREKIAITARLRGSTLT